jgi:hypothetical protein
MADFNNLMSQQEFAFVISTISVADPDPESAAFLTPGSGSGMGKKSKSGSGLKDPDQISESLEITFWVKILKFFDADPGWKKIRIRDKHPGSATLSTIQFLLNNKKIYCTVLLLASISSTTTAMIWPSTARCRTSPSINRLINQSIILQSINGSNKVTIALVLTDQSLFISINHIVIKHRGHSSMSDLSPVGSLSD